MASVEETGGFAYSDQADNGTDGNIGNDVDTDGNDQEVIREQDRLLPIANVARIMKQAVPTNAKIAKDAKECVQECVSEFISFVTSEAADRCQQEKRKTVNGEDIIWAMEALGFDQYSQLMKVYLQRFKEITKMDKGMLGQTHLPFDGAYAAGMPMGFESLMATQQDQALLAAQMAQSKPEDGQ